MFLLKLGDEPRGIIGHGRVVREQYENEHYIAEKAAEGKKGKAIDVEFDQLFDYDRDKIVSQAELVDKCAAQHWSPQGSGIEIKPEVLPTLQSLWKEVIDINLEDGFWPSQKEYPVNLSKDDWKRFIQEIEMPSHKGCMRVLACFVDIGGVASPKALSNKYKGHPSVYVGSVVNTGMVFLLNKSFTTFSGGHNARALLFPMEKVFESYVAQQLKKTFADLNWDISTQDKGYYLFDSPRQFALRPDIVITRDNGSVVILDTKWKRLVDNPRINYGISQSDMYQMYAYSKKYENKFETPEVWLLYPITDEMREHEEISFYSDDGVNVRLFFVDVANVEESLLLLKDQLIG